MTVIPIQHLNLIETIYLCKDNKILRRTTAAKRQELEQRQQERAARNKLKTKRVVEVEAPEYRRLTQEELLAEAKITEEINLASLDAYQKLELEKKKTKSHKNVFNGPTIRYHSTTMPLLDSDDEASDNLKQSRNFITFSDEETLRNIFGIKKADTDVAKVPQKCVATGLPAKYFDPLTNCPYANLFAFKKIREIYAAKIATDN